jgi:uncharacterized protein YdhG (YjbR/CyaY superfamily)
MRKSILLSFADVREKIKMDAEEYKTIDEYITGFPKNVQAILTKMRQVIQETAPEAREAIAYRMPTFRLNGNLVHFAGFSNHIGFYPTPSGILAFQKALEGYETSKGAIRFPLDRPIPYALVKKITKFRVKEASDKKAENSQAES